MRVTEDVIEKKLSERLAAKHEHFNLGYWSSTLVLIVISLAYKNLGL